MAEFGEVMKQLGRICTSNFTECDICSIRQFCPSETFLDKYTKSERAERLEEMVMKWAAEHPEPVYPTWYEWLTSIGAVTRKVKPDVASILIETGLLDPIPADIAEKLGIPPIVERLFEEEHHD